MKRMALILGLLLITQATFATGVDPLKNLQWGLKNTGQTVDEALTDIEYDRIKGVPGIDVDRKMTTSAYVSRMKRDVIVAVIDSGVDVDHPDLQGHIFINKADCDSTGRPPFQSDEDKDGNSYPGDCMGWNVSGHGDANRVIDDLGHGTHVAGIIAATEGNNLGIAGVTPRVKILPIKVTYKGDQGDGYTRRMLNALKYALSMKADVINLSLGWPAAADTKDLQDEVHEAVRRGVIVVVAAGNNTTDKPIYPCSYEGVVCVGAIRPDGKMSLFSNYGAHVDLLAPGSHILSLIPSQIHPSQFSLTGYDFKSGTSQATPFVSAAFAMLKGLYPQSSPDELMARFYLTSQKRPSNTSSIGGLIQIDKAIDVAAQPAVYPVGKGTDMLEVQPDGSFLLNVALKNYWSRSGSVQLAITAPDGISLDRTEVSLDSLDQGAQQSLAFRGTVLHESRDHQLSFTVALTLNGATRTYVLTKTLVHPVSPLQTALPHIDVDLSALNQGRPPSHLVLQTIKNQFSADESPEYYLLLQKMDQRTLVLLRQNGSRLTPTTFEMPASVRILNFVKMDLDKDGRADYLIQTFEFSKDSKPVFKFWYLDGRLRPLYNVAAFTYDVSVAMPNWRDLAWIYTTYRGRAMRVPLFIYKGRIAPVDRDKDPFGDATDDVLTDRVYYYLPNAAKAELEIRSFDTYRRTESLKRTVGAKYPADINFKLVYPQSLDELSRGEAWILLEVIDGDRSTRYYQMRFGAKARLEGVRRIQGRFNLQGFKAVRQPGFDASSTNLFLARTQSANIIEFAWLKGLKKPVFYSYKHAQLGDNIIGPLAAAAEKGGVRLIVETKVHVVSVLQGPDGHQSLTINPIHRSSILDNSVFTELLAPIKVHGQTGIYMDSSQLYRGHVYAITPSGDRFSAETANSLEISKDCSALNPWIHDSDSDFIVYCEDEGSGRKSLYRMPIQ